MRAIFSRSAGKAMDRLDPVVRSRVTEGIKKFLADPERVRAAKPLQNEDGLFRLRVGDWRVVFCFERSGESGEPVMLVVGVDHRSDIYR